MTDEEGIWYCEDSGFVAFINDFGDITTGERQEISDFLSRKPRPTDIKGRLERLEEIYGLRHKEPRFRNLLLRVLARWHQNLGDRQRANVYRKSALRGIVNALEENLPEDQRLEYLYLAGSYSRLFGDIAASDRYFSLLKNAIHSLKDQKLSGYAEYLLELAREIETKVLRGLLEYP